MLRLIYLNKNETSIILKVYFVVDTSINIELIYLVISSIGNLVLTKIAIVASQLYPKSVQLHRYLS